MSVVLNRDVAQILYFARQFDDAIAQSKKTLEMDGNFETTYNWLGFAYDQKGLKDLAVDALLKRNAVSKDLSPQEKSAYEAAYKRAGWRGFWEQHLEWLKQRDKRYRWTDRWTYHVEIADVYVRLGNKDRAIESLERGYRERSKGTEGRQEALKVGLWLKRNPVFDSVRSDPRFKNLLSRMNLSQ
jgi:tetratricopeptide (TPR) repeat protein